MKKNLLFAFTFLFFLPAVYSKNINFQVVQNNPGFDTVFAVSNLFEQALSDFFFESGHIVSNSPVFIKEDSQSDSAELKKALADTLLGGMDVLVRLEIKYDEKTENIVLNADDFKLLDGAKCSENSVLKIKYLDAISSKSGKAQANIKADKSGVYALTFTYSNNAEGGHHAYNVDLIEQYVTLDVNGEKQDVWARNTYSFDTYKTVTVYVKLKNGNNKITLSNSGKTKFDNQESFAPKISSVSLNELEKQ